MAGGTVGGILALKSLFEGSGTTRYGEANGKCAPDTFLTRHVDRAAMLFHDLPGAG